MWQKVSSPWLLLPLVLLSLANKGWEKYRENHNMITRLRSSGAL
jgi:hypothetical protein